MAATLVEFNAAADDDADIQDLEDLLETFFAQVDKFRSQVEAVQEQINDTETYVAADMDSKRNALFELMVVTAVWNVSVMVRKPTRLSGRGPPLPKEKVHTSVPNRLQSFTTLTGAFAMMVRARSFAAALARLVVMC